MIAAYREPDRERGRELMRHLIDSISRGVPAALTEVITLGRTLTKQAADILAYFDRLGTSNGPTEAVNGRLEHLRGTASGSATSPTTSPDHYSRPADSDPNYTLDCEEPIIAAFDTGRTPFADFSASTGKVAISIRSGVLMYCKAKRLANSSRSGVPRLGIWNRRIEARAFGMRPSIVASLSSTTSEGMPSLVDGVQIRLACDLADGRDEWVRSVTTPHGDPSVVRPMP
jgi:Transposase